MKKLISLVLFLTLCLVGVSARTDVTSKYLQNANLSALTGWNYGDDGYDYTDWKKDGNVPVVEFYHEWGENPGTPIGSTRNFHFTQNVTLPAGDYRLVVNAFYREGAGDGTSKANLVAGTKQKNVIGLTDGEIKTFSGSNDLYKAANAFSQGYYVNFIDFTIDAEQEVTLGMNGYIDTYISWCVLGPVKLYQYSDGEEKEDEPNLIVSTNYVAPDWSEFPILFSHSWKDNTSEFTSPKISTGETSMTATVIVDQNATLVFEYGEYWQNGQGDLIVYLDDQIVQSVNSIEYYHQVRYFVEMTSGAHVIKWTYVPNNSEASAISIKNIGILASPDISVNVLEPGSLGTEVLYNTDHIKKARKLTVTGNINDEDWARIKMMSYLLYIDLSGTQITSIEDKFFSKDNFPFLHYVRLPETLTTIGDYAFEHSYIDDINFPSSLKTIGDQAFRNTKVREAMLPNTMTSIGSWAFEDCIFLKKANFPENIKVIPIRTFQQCLQLTDLTLHEGLRELESDAIRYVPYSKRLPSTITTIGSGACADNLALTDTLFIPESCTSIGKAAFQECSNVKVVVLPVGYSQCSTGDYTFNFWSINTLIVKSPTVLTGTEISTIVPPGRRSAITVKVPSYLVNSYKLDSYWYEFGSIEGFSTAGIKDWYIHQPLVMNNSRFEGEPNLWIQWSSASLKLNGDAAMDINNFYVDWCSPVISNCNNITINGSYTSCYQTSAMQWYFISLPFNCRVGDIIAGSDAEYAIRYYDGANRAINGTGSSWKNFGEDDIIPAGTGFIYQTSKDGFSMFYSQNDASKQNALSCNEFIKTLEINNSDIQANKGWNLVGNPWHCYYNIHNLNFTAPIITWNGSTYVAYSITDDDYAIRPNEAFFVQCPNEEYNTIGFPIQGRQLTSDIESQNAARPVVSQANGRQVVNLTVSNGEMKDMTRVVLNEQASTEYEVSCDASKFMSMDNSVPQIYTLDNKGTMYAINERPIKEGYIDLGFYAGQTGDYTISVTRCDAEQVFITDNQTGETSEITNSAYAFSAKAGADNSRFTLSFVPDDVTAVSEIEKTESAGKVEVYSIDGKFLGTDASHLNSGLYIIRQGKNVRKLVVR